MKKLLATSLLALGLMAGTSHAIPIMSLTAGTPDVLDGTYNPEDGPTGVGPGDSVTVADSVGQGLLLDGPATMIFTFLGEEAGFNNVFNLYVGDVDVFNNNASYLDSSGPLSISPDGGFVPFKFISNNTADVINGAVVGGAGALATIAFKLISLSADENTAVYLALFNDFGGGDADYDDMVIRIEATRANQQVVPLPAGLLLLLSGLAGLGFIGRSRAKKA